MKSSPIKSKSLLRWKERDDLIVPEFALNWKGNGVANGYGFGEWVAENNHLENLK